MIDQIQKTLAKIDPQVNKNSKDTISPKLEKSSVIPTPADGIDSADLSKLAKLDNVAGLSASAPIDYDQVNKADRINTIILIAQSTNSFIS